MRKKDWSQPEVWKNLNKSRTKRLYGNALFRSKSYKLEYIEKGDFDSEPNLYNIASFCGVDLDMLTTLYYAWRDSLAKRISNGKRSESSFPRFGKEYGSPYNKETNNE